MGKRPRSLGKYRIEARVARGGFADVYKAYDKVEGIHVALKIPQAHLMNKAALEDFRKEVRLTARLDHPSILPIKTAEFVDHVFVIVYPLGQRTLGDRMGKSLTVKAALEYAEQIFEALAFAHRKKIIHCDVKPENFILFPGNRLRLADFGIAKFARRTLSASGSGTVGYIAPEQALGRPSLRSDVFSAGLIVYQMLAGELPQWPFRWPFKGVKRLKERVHPELVEFLRRALAVEEEKRFRDAVQMLQVFRRLKPRANRSASVRRKKKRPKARPIDMEAVRRRTFLKHFRRALQTRGSCPKCEGPVCERMLACPWCGHEPKTYKGPSRFPARCGRCKRGVKLDWKFCASCYGAAVGPRSEREFPDQEYAAHCGECRKPLLPFSRYCPWCRARVRRRWSFKQAPDRCPHCRWGVTRKLWSFCPWCARKFV
ncbi:MAG: serine/threonine-protein kinase [Planctomycetota bacterium]|nr:serine/threonine-protein kinase [Planctomycetota bacterium]